jgi:hypothetical protein
MGSLQRREPREPNAGRGVEQPEPAGPPGRRIMQFALKHDFDDEALEVSP